jgi:glycosyltransferase involved in cell wall biosynthesis
MERVSVLIVIDSLQGGGAERMVETYARLIDRSRFSLEICCLVRGGTYLEAIQSSGVAVHVLNKRWPVDPFMFVRLMRLLKKERYQVVHCFMFTANFWGRIAAIITGVPVRIAAERNVDSWKDPVRRWLDRRLARWSSKVVAVSKRVEVFYRDEVGIPVEKLTTIRNGVPPDLLRPTGRSRQSIRAELGLPLDVPVVIQVGRLVPQKGYQVLLDAMRDVRARHPGVRLLILGEGPLRDELAAHARTLGIDDAVVFAGFRRDVLEVLRASDLFVLASWREGLPVSLLEAMAACLPAVVTSVGGNDEVVLEGETGYIVQAGDAAMMADRIIRLLDDPVLRQQMSRAARERVETVFSAERMVHETEALYERCLKERLQVRGFR